MSACVFVCVCMCVCVCVCEREREREGERVGTSSYPFSLISVFCVVT